jgi:hypothetical protein
MAKCQIDNVNKYIGIYYKYIQIYHKYIQIYNQGNEI